MARRSNNLRFILICLVLFLLGAILRFQSGWTLFPATVEAEAPAQETGDADWAARKETILQFYNLVDKGRYQEAHQLVLENKWQKVAEGVYAVVGLTSQDEFVDVTGNEIGPNGMGLNIVSIDTLGQVALPRQQWDAQVRPDQPELYTLAFLPPDEVQAVYEVEVAGVLLGRCARWDFDTHVLVARLNSDGWKVLLPGIVEPTKPHHEEWFLERNPLKDVDIVGVMKGEE